MTKEPIAELRELALALPEAHYPPLTTMGERESLWVRAPEYEKVKALLPKLLDEVERSRALLRRIEWSARVGQDSDAVCPECEEWETFGEHAKDCELAALIGKAP